MEGGLMPEALKPAWGRLLKNILEMAHLHN